MSFLIYLLVIKIVVHEKTNAAQLLPTNLFGTKNSYKASLELWEDEPIVIEDEDFRACCQPIQLAGVYRHGMRYPTRTDMDNVVDILSELQGRQVDSELLGRLQSVVTAFENAGPGQLADSGHREQQELGRRAARRHPGLFGADATVMAFFTSSSSRAADSLRSFRRALDAELDLNVSASSSTEQRDDLLRFYHDCPRYAARVKNNRSALHHLHKFRRDAYPAIRSRLARRLGLVDDEKLGISDDQLDSLYNVAGIELAVDGSSNWASLLSSDDFPLLEYATDLKQYYKLGYGYAINRDISCPLISHIFQQMDERIKANRSAASGGASFYFGHSVTVVPLMAALGLFRDAQPLTAAVSVWNLSSSTLGDRQFRTSRIDPMSANVALTLYDCNDCQPLAIGRGGSDTVSSSMWQNASDQYVLRLDVSERPVNWPFNNLAGFVEPYSVVRQAYSHYIDRCRFNEQCDMSAATSTRSGILHIACYLALLAGRELFHTPL